MPETVCSKSGLSRMVVTPAARKAWVLDQSESVKPTILPLNPVQFPIHNDIMLVFVCACVGVKKLLQRNYMKRLDCAYLIKIF